jgi:hypothetical protein
MTDDEPADGDGDPDDGSGPEEPLGDIAEEVRTEDSTTAPEADDDGSDAGDGVPDWLEGPSSDVASEIDAGVDEGSPGDQLFEAVDDVGDVDREALWRQVAGEDAAARVGEVRSEVEGDPEGPTVQRPDASPGFGDVSVEDREERVVDKAKYCHNCEYFSPPPELRCTHSGTEILELVDVDHFRVVDCPIVAEDEELENV